MSKMKEGWEYKKLGEVCELYQPKTLSTKELIENGDYPVYGANGIIGRYSKYNHEKSEILMTCRGATCGTINISQPFAWINGNAMVIHPITDNIYNAFLVYQLKGIDLSDVITGAAQPQITRQTLSPKIIGIPKYSVQLNIVSELDLLSGIVEKQKAQLEELDKLAQSIFYDMFGDPNTNTHNFPIVKMEDLCSLITKGTTPTSLGFSFVEEGINFIKVESFNKDESFNLNNVTHITKECNQALKRSILEENDILICIAGATCGRLALVPREALPANTNQAFGILRLKDKSKMLTYIYNFLHTSFIKNQVNELKKGVAQPNLTLNHLRNLNILIPSDSIRQEFAAKVEAIEAMKAKVRQSLKEAETLFNERMDYYFN